jgi:Transglycosylase-like domain
MRRKPIAWLLSLSTAITPLASPAATGVLERFGHHPGLTGRAELAQVSVRRAAHQLMVPSSVTELGLIVAARAQGLSVPELRARWQLVANCEVGGNWAMTGPVYSGIGFLNATWAAFGGAQFAPRAGQASRDEQILVAMRVTGGWIPDQNGCSSW